MAKIPKAQLVEPHKRINPSFSPEIKKKDAVVFSFAAINKNEYFNLDSTCQNWSHDLFTTMQTVSTISMSDIYSGKFSGKNSTLRIHPHHNAESPCQLPPSVSLEDMWQIRISRNKGGIHGIFYDNIFYVIWFDPHHNLYPNERYGGLKKIQAPTTCCKDRDEIVIGLNVQLEAANKHIKFLEEYIEETEQKQI